MKKNRTKIVAITLGFLTFIGCQQEKKETILLPKKEGVVENIPQKKLPKNDSQDEQGVVSGFLNWYSTHFDEIYSFDVIKGGPADNSENYYVDFKEVDKEINYFKKSNYLSVRFLKNFYENYVKGEQNFKENPQNDGPPEGFDADYFFRTQESFEEDLKLANKIKFTTQKVNQNTSTVQFQFKNSGMKYEYVLKKEGAEWKIDEIKIL